MMFRSFGPLIALALLVAACGGPPESAPAGSQIIVEMTDFKLSANVPSVKAGTYKIGVRNLANMEHSFQVLKTDLAHDKLPIEGGAKAREDGKVGEIKSLPAGKSGAVTVDLTPGRYVLICNTAGHYQLGMHVPFTVEAP
jgi:uncharacterized cupredoxin-like copper-binding protein